MGAAESSLDSADPEEVGLRLASALRARWFGASEELSHSKADLQADSTLVAVRKSLLGISQLELEDFLAASAGTPARRELTDALWEFGAFHPYALAAVKADPGLCRLSYKCVPRHATESEFWRVFFVHAYAALAERAADESPCLKSRRLSALASPRRLPPIAPPRGLTPFLRQEPWARVGGEVLWLLSDASHHLLAGTLHGGAALTDGPMAGVCAISLSAPSAAFELGAPQALGAEWSVCCWLLVGAQSGSGARALACGSGSEQYVCLRDGELGAQTEASGFAPCGLSVRALQPGWYHIAAVGLRGKTSFYLNGEPVGTAAAQCAADLRFVGNAPQAFGACAQPAGCLADVRAFARALDEAEVVALSRMVPEAERPAVPTAEALRAFASRRAVELARQKLQLAAEMIGSASAVLGPALPHAAAGVDLGAMREQLLLLSSAVDREADER